MKVVNIIFMYTYLVLLSCGETLAVTSHALCLHFAGTFGQVLECWDREMRVLVAIKVVRSIKKYREAAKVEVDVLQLLGKYDRIGSR